MTAVADPRFTGLVFAIRAVSDLNALPQARESKSGASGVRATPISNAVRVIAAA
jgi:hypothetical protein